MKRICVYAGSNPGTSPTFTEKAKELGAGIAHRGWELVYGGSNMGLMGSTANAVLEAGGKAIGVMPRGLFRGEMRHSGLTEFYEAENMHGRKAKMAELSDGFIALPGGYGTFEELFEILCWAQLGIHQKPVGILNIDDYYTPLLQLIEQAIFSGFMPATHRDLLLVDQEPDRLLDKMEAYKRPVLSNKWNEED
ncbi:TIGR00730 family Rossman fold protein [Brevibacillus ruminantium]|uniref:Cytokinin riboside 5'-monophosphate phosphoribohydrolase n=1 Tax=Brevibacillus ruminantium TaxID=2950604 RepID=A0ABY4WA67_9BACL|nr:TIGR00730 family Rossman fold protein [Brevibacillus ruminantium]USG63948.1 TIGR00730 family Rossman fold protein [Brevibacillus ruminantium]